MKKHKIYLDIIRILAIFGVLYGHTGNEAMYMFTTQSGVAHWLGLFAWDLVLSSPFIFFMVAGGLLLGKEESIGTLFRHRILRYILVIVVSGIFQSFYWTAVSGDLKDFSLIKTLRNLYSTATISQYWFLYTYLGMLLMLPFLRMIAARLTKETALYLLGLTLAFKVCFPAAERIFDLGQINISVYLVENAMLLPLLGYAMEVTLKDFFEVRRNRILLYITALVTMGIDMVYAHKTLMGSGQASALYAGITFAAMSVYILIRKAAGNHEFKKGTVKILTICGEGVMLIYILEPQLRSWLHFIYETLAPVITWFPAAVLWLLAAEICGMVIAFVFHLIPGTKKFI